MKEIKMKKIRNISDEVNSLLIELEKEKKDSERYKTIAENIKTLRESNSFKNDSISKEEIFKAVVYIGGIILVLYFERTGSITSKVFSTLRRL
jgi:hypothetical protein